MKLKLKEDSREWQKFAAVLCVLLGGVGYLAIRRGVLPQSALFVLGGLIGLVLISSWICPRAYRGIYRGGMTVSFKLGQVMGQVLLTLLFFLILCPLGLLLRLLGKDLLRMRRGSPGESYWQAARDGRDFDRMF